MPSSENLKIPLQDILSATNKFAESKMIARGGFGKVYRGQLEQHGIVAIKRLDHMHGQGDNEFGMEVTLLSCYKHENLVTLVGFCQDGEEKILVYKFEANGSLDRVLPNKELTWMRRLQICLDAARGLKYLHDGIGSHHSIIHRDIKSSNILLDDKWKAKISDFGLSKIALTNVHCSVIYSLPCGTLGYLDPEFYQGVLTKKSDVYSFGIVLFEVLFGKLVSIPVLLNKGNYFSVEMALNHYENKSLDEMIDPDLRSQMSPASLGAFSAIAYQCLKNSRKDRPTMGLVVEELEKALGYQQEASRGFSHDVYISFRDQDTAMYVDSLCSALEKEGLSTYKDDVTRARREAKLLEAIERSRAYIIIFSRKFAANSWNLVEVAKIIECAKETKKVVIPVYIDVYPSDVRTQRGYFGESMSKYDTHPKMAVWRNALVEATTLPSLQDDSDYGGINNLAKAAAARLKGNSERKIIKVSKNRKKNQVIIKL